MACKVSSWIQWRLHAYTSKEICKDEWNKLGNGSVIPRPNSLLKSNIPHDFSYYTDLPKSHSNNRDTRKSRSMSKNSVTACHYPWYLLGNVCSTLQTSVMSSFHFFISISLFPVSPNHHHYCSSTETYHSFIMIDA